MVSKNKKISILINAYSVAPNKGSEPGMAWNWIINLAKYVDIHVITEGRWRDEIEDELKKITSTICVHFYYNPVSSKVHKMSSNQGDWRFYYHYRKWQKTTLVIAQEIIAKEDIDIIHQLNMVGYREPGLLWQIKGIPKVWGPIGGFGGIPANYLKLYSKSSASKQIVKQFINKWQVYLPYIKKPITQVDVLVACNSLAKNALSKIAKKDVAVISEVGATKSKVSLPVKDFNSTILKLVWVGKYDERKALSIALDVFKQFKDEQIELHVFGVSKQEVSGRYHFDLENVVFHGWLPHDEVQNKVQQCHALLFTSLFEATGTAVLESLSLGLPVLCHNTCGQGDIINDSCGAKVEMQSVSYSIEKFKDIIVGLYSDRSILENLSMGALKRVDELSWVNNSEKMIKIYKSLLK